MLVKGNHKIDKSVLCWSITPIASCPNCSDCKDTCYALGPYSRWKNVKNAWDKNFNESMGGDFVEKINNQLSRSKDVKVVRIHVSGDFYSQKYIDKWFEIMSMFPAIKFYTYTKVMNMFDFSKLLNLKNFNLINSICPDGNKNYGNKERIVYLESLGYITCPATTEHGLDSSISCGRNCKICFSNSKVAFYYHK
jgi:hypothetical protein